LGKTNGIGFANLISIYRVNFRENREITLYIAVKIKKKIDKSRQPWYNSLDNKEFA